MGISGLLPFLKKASQGAHLKDFRGQTAAVDAYCWLHKGAFSCADKLVKGEPTNGLSSTLFSSSHGHVHPGVFHHAVSYYHDGQPVICLYPVGAPQSQRGWASSGGWAVSPLQSPLREKFLVPRRPGQQSLPLQPHPGGISGGRKVVDWSLSPPAPSVWTREERNSS
ncbi:Exonuclease 1 [Portunus trituberculatus]|uniref:Exonuclease 1 n=1 Tax=Portunus trituberculatus TaxID=210409 RepID=A0A5B7DUI7_PORTR|nr:Exonuclease 1 [Portunus trituberculatus]